MKRLIASITIIAALVFGQTMAGHSPSIAPASATAARPDLPVFAYYYQWFDPSSWNRAKIDYPALGHYSSDDPRVMRQQIVWAKAAGIGGFIVSWKSSTINNRRLRVLMTVAEQEHFLLAMIYQGLDFNRKPLAASRVAADLVTFRDQFAPNPVFYRLNGKPLTIWSGTWAYSHSDVALATGPVRKSMLVLSTQKGVSDYERLADVTDGDAYYWSSVNPATNPTYPAKLKALATAIHAHGQYWIAPFAPGFDARLVGGAKTVDRKDGATLQTEYAAAINSSPDVLGLISWNEFSENTYVEPSQKYGNRYLTVLTQLLHAAPPDSPSAADSSQSGAPGPGDSAIVMNISLLGGFVALLVGAVGYIARRRRQRERRNISPQKDPIEPRAKARIE